MRSYSYGPRTPKAFGSKVCHILASYFNGLSARTSIVPGTHFPDEPILPTIIHSWYKLCHWAFDAGLLKLDFDANCSAYVLEIPTGVRDAAAKAKFDLGYFEPLAGKIPASRLPASQNAWPSPKYLAELNKFMFVGAA